MFLPQPGAVNLSSELCGSAAGRGPKTQSRVGAASCAVSDSRGGTHPPPAVLTGYGYPAGGTGEPASVPPSLALNCPFIPWDSCNCLPVLWPSLG